MPTRNAGARVQDRRGSPSSPLRSSSVLLTGVTGFVGEELLYQLLIETVADVVCLVRAADDVRARARLKAIATGLFGPGGWEGIAPRVRVVRGDLTLPGLGLSAATREALVERTTHIVHGAASVRFDLPIGEARAINYGGTETVLELARAALEQGRLQRFSYVSTAFVSGMYGEWFGEDDLDVGQRFRNSYERSKFEAEVLLRSTMRQLPIIVLRPSIVVGRSQSGATSAFNVIYWPLRMYADGRLRYAPAPQDLPVDIVPVDFVARGVVEALQRGEPGYTYTLAAGSRSTQAEVIGEMAARVFSVRPPRLASSRIERMVAPLVSPLLSVGPWRRAGRAARQYLPYFLHGSRFDTTHADALLRPRGIEPPEPAALLEPVLEFARSTDFGRDRAAIEAQARRLTRRRRQALERASRRAETEAPEPAAARSLVGSSRAKARSGRI
jgi:thioester reductase-like protein